MAEIVKGYEDNGVLSTLKHWVGDGGTAYGSSTTGSYTVDQGVTHDERGGAVPHAHRAVPARRRPTAPARSCRPTPAWTTGTGPVKMHGNAHLLTDVLKGKLKFSGFVISDWQAIDQLPGDYRSDITTSINAGLDMIMVPYQYGNFITLLTEQVEAGAVPQSRIDDAVRRILRKKFELGLFEHPYADRTGLDQVGSAEHRAVARQAAAESQTLLKNTGRLLPLAATPRCTWPAATPTTSATSPAAGRSAGRAAAARPPPAPRSWPASGSAGAQVTYSKDASADLTGSDVGVVVVGETPYAEGVGDVGNGRADLSLSAADRAAIDKVCGAMKCAVLVVSGRPMLLDPAQFDEVDAVVASWLPGSEGAGVADTLFGARPFTGRLPSSWARTMAQQPINVGDAAYDPAYPFGWGLRTDAAKPRLQAARDALAELSRKPGQTAEVMRLKLAVISLDLALSRANWNADGSVRNEPLVLASLTGASALLEGLSQARAQFDPIVSVARDVVQARMVAKGVSAQGSALTGSAEQELLAGRPYHSMRRLTAAWSALR